MLKLKAAKPLVCLLAAALASAGCFKSETVVSRVPNNNNTTMEKLDGVHYSLPQTVTTAAAPIKRKAEKPGELEKFTPCFYPKDIADARIILPRVTYSLEDPTVGFRVQPDPEQHFIISVRGGFFENKSLLLDYAPGGIITKGEASSENQALDFTLQAAKTVTSVVTGIIGIPSASPQAVVAEMEKRNITPPSPITQDEADTLNCLGTIVLGRAELRRKMKEADDKATTAKDKKATQADLKAADELLAKARKEEESVRLYLEQRAASPNAAEAQTLIANYKRAKDVSEEHKALETRRLNLVSGRGSNVEVSAEALKLMLQEFDASINRRKALFFGTEKTDQWTGRFEYVPNTLPGQAAALFWFAEREGVCLTRLSHRQGVVVPPDFLAKTCPAVPGAADREQPLAEAMDVVFLTLSKDMADQTFRDQMLRAQTNLDTARQKRGWYYRIPANALVALKVGSLEKHGDLVKLNGLERVLAGLSEARGLQRETLEVAQLGVTVSVPASGAGRTNQSTVEFYASGALKNFKYASNSLLQNSHLVTAQETAQTAIDARTKSNERQAAESKDKAAAADPLNKLKKELEYYETLNRLNEEKRKAEGANTNTNTNGNNTP